MLDAIGLHIVRILQQKARIPNVEVARRVGMAPSAVLERIRKLEKQGIIEGYEVRLDPARFGRGMVSFVGVTCRRGIDEADLGRRLAAIEAVQEVHHLTGCETFQVKLRVSGTAELEQILRERIRSLEGVDRTHTRIALSTVKETLQIPLIAAGTDRTER